MSAKNLSSQLRHKKKNGEIIVAAGLDDIKMEKSCTQAGCDLLLLHPTAHLHRSKNPYLAGCLALGNTNKEMEKMVNQFSRILTNPYPLAAINASDPFKLDHHIFQWIKQNKICGIHNYPSMGLVDGNFGINLDLSNIGFKKEIEFFVKAKEKNLFTCAFVRTQKQAIQMLRIPVDVLIFYIGLGDNYHNTTDYSAEGIHRDISRLHKLTSAARKISSKIPILFYSEMVETTEQIMEIIDSVAGIDGYYYLPINGDDITEEELSLCIRRLKSKRKKN